MRRRLSVQRKAKSESDDISERYDSDLSYEDDRVEDSDSDQHLGDQACVGRKRGSREMAGLGGYLGKQPECAELGGGVGDEYGEMNVKQGSTGVSFGDPVLSGFSAHELRGLGLKLGNTTKYLFAAAVGVPVYTGAWLQACAAAGKWLDPGSKKHKSCGFVLRPGRKALAEDVSARILAGFRVYLHGDAAWRGVFATVVRHAGGLVLFSSRVQVVGVSWLAADSSKEGSAGHTTPPRTAAAAFRTHHPGFVLQLQPGGDGLGRGGSSSSSSSQAAVFERSVRLGEFVLVAPQLGEAHARVLQLLSLWQEVPSDGVPRLLCRGRRFYRPCETIFPMPEGQLFVSDHFEERVPLAAVLDKCEVVIAGSSSGASGGDVAAGGGDAESAGGVDGAADVWKCERMSFAGSGPQAGAPYVAAPYMPDYNAQSRGYGSVPAMPYAAMLPYGMSPIPAPQPYHAGLPADSSYDADAAALAQGLDSNLVLSPQQPHMMPPPMPGAPPQYYGQQRGGPGGYAGGPNAPPQYYGPPSGAHNHHGGRGQQQMGMQPHMRQPGGMGPATGGPGHHHHMGMNGHQTGFRGDMGHAMPGTEQPVTEESLATFFADCGTVMDCRICGDPNSAMRFAFIEFLEELGAQQALSKTGSILGTSQLRVLPSKTAIVPVNKELMPRSHEELERCSRTVYVANIDKKVEREDVRNFFEQLCGKVNKIRLLGDVAHSTRIAFIEFIQAEAAMAALNCSGALLGALPLRVSPSKTPVRGDREDKEGRQQGSRQQRPGSSGSKAAQSGSNGTTAAVPTPSPASNPESVDATEPFEQSDEQQETQQGAQQDGQPASPTSLRDADAAPSSEADQLAADDTAAFETVHADAVATAEEAGEEAAVEAAVAAQEVEGAPSAAAEHNDTAGSATAEPAAGSSI
eukprot:gene5933-6173_t